MNTRSIITKLSPAALAALCSVASASIVSTTGQALQIGPPAACGNTQLMGPVAYAWDELQNVSLTGVLCDETQNPGGSASPTFGAISGTFDSHFISFQGVPNFNAQGTVTFNNPIVGVIWKNALLDLTDGSLGWGGTAYPTTYFLRGLNALTSVVSINANVLTFNITTNTPVGEVGQIRVLTHSVPGPGVPATVLAGAALMGARRRR